MTVGSCPHVNWLFAMQGTANPHVESGDPKVVIIKFSRSDSLVERFSVIQVVQGTSSSKEILSWNVTVLGSPINFGVLLVLFTQLTAVTSTQYEVHGSRPVRDTLDSVVWKLRTGSSLRKDNPEHIIITISKSYCRVSVLPDHMKLQYLHSRIFPVLRYLPAF